jgi:hypothetical protein
MRIFSLRDVRCFFFSPSLSLLQRASAYLRAMNVNVNRSSSHLSVCEAICDFFPVEVASEISVDRESSILVKLARPRTYLIRIATMQRLPTNQQLNTFSF